MLRILHHYNIINKMEESQISKYDFMKDFITRSVNDASEITINYGKKETDFIFNTKIAQINNDIIPVINSIFHEDIKSFHLKNIKKYYFEDYIYEIEKLDKSSLPIPKFNNYIKNDIIKNTYKSKLIDYEIYDNTTTSKTDICIKSNSTVFEPHQINNSNFYNHKESFILLEWKCSHDVNVLLKVYSKYTTIELKVDLIEQRKIPPLKMKTILKMSKQLETIIDFLKPN